MDKNKLFKDAINYVKVQCKCGKVCCFLRNHSVECTRCGRTVYPTKESEFKEKMKIKLRKELSKNEQSIH